MVSLIHLSYQDSLVFVVGAALGTHLIFKRTETHEPVYVSLLLLALPTALAGLLVEHTSSILSALTTTLLTFWTSLTLSIVGYRLSPWHPLAQYPGPILCKISKFRLAFLSLSGKQHEYYYNLHQKYGDIVRVGPNELSIRDVDAVAPLMGPNGVQKGAFWEGRVPEDEPVKPLIALRNKQEHTRRRRPWTRAFSTNALKGYETIVTNRCAQLVETLGNQKGAVDMTKWISYFSYDAMTDIAFSGGTEMMRDGDVDGLWHLLEAGQKVTIFMGHVPWLGQLFYRYPVFANEIKSFRAYAKKQALNRKKMGSPHKDLFHHLIDEDGVSDNPPTVAEVVNDGGLAIIAGSDTTSSALTNLFYLLLTNPTTYKRLQAEIDELGDDVMDYAKQAHLSYLNGAINESLRLFPPILSGSQRFSDEKEGRIIGNKNYVPQGTYSFIPFYCLQRDPRYFSPLPNDFIPERWVSPEEQMKLEPELFKDQSSVALNVNAFVPFSVGAYNCAGKNLAWMEMRMLVCLMMQKYDLELADEYRPEQWEEDMLDFFVMLKGKLPVVLTPRK